MTDRQILVQPEDPTPSPLSGPWGSVDPAPGAGEARRTGHHQQRRLSVSRWEAIGVVLTGVGLLLLMFFAYLFVFTPLTHTRDQHRLLQSLVGNPRAVFKLVAGHLPSEGGPVGVLTIPALHQRQVIVMGTSAADLQEGPGLMAGTALPGQAGNAVVAGRRDTYGAPFGSLGTLVPGDRVQIVDGVGTVQFKVSSVRTVAGEPDVLTARGQRWLTLVTSSSPLVSQNHVVVVAKATSAPVGMSSSAGHQDSTPLSLDGDTAAGILAFLWSLLFLVGLGATLYSIRRWGQVWLSYVLAVPVLMACGLFACESLARCLPATL